MSGSQKAPMNFGPHLANLTQAGGLTFAFGRLGFASDGQLAEGIVAQTERCLDLLEVALATVRLNRNNVVKTTIWLIDIALFNQFNETYATFFGDHRPARSTV